MFINLEPVYNLNYKPGQVYFTFNSKAPISQGVSYFTYKDDDDYTDLEIFSHCGICIGENLGVSALNNGISYENLSEIFKDKNRRIVFREPRFLDSIGPKHIISLSKLLIGIPYDWKLASGFAILNCYLSRLILTKERRHDLLKSFKTPGKFICSEFVMFVMHNCGLSDDIDYLKSPHEVFEHLMFKAWKKELTEKLSDVIMK